MAYFFIQRPIFAWVIALFISVIGVLAIQNLPVSYYPPVAPPSITVSVTYPGASVELLEQSVITVIENELNSVDDLIYMESVSESSGSATITLAFEPGTSPDLAQVDVQNKLERAKPRLPQAVIQQGVFVDKTSSNYLMIMVMVSEDPEIDYTRLGDYAARYVVPEIQRIKGVGTATLSGTEQAMRIWLDMDKLDALHLTPGDVNAAISQQNVQISSGIMGAQPYVLGQDIAVSILVEGQLRSVEEFGNIILRATENGATVRLHDVARIELGGQIYNRNTFSNGRAVVGIPIQPAPGSNAVETVRLVREKMDELSRFFPDGVTYRVPLDTSLFVSISIKKVVVTLIEAVILVFVVMLLFLQNLRYTLVPTLVVPVALLGTFGVLLALGYSINVLTMFAMVLVIGILVDDAIVVVENVERLMAEEGLGPKEATVKAMGQITGAIVGITVVLVSVFVPMAFFSGSVGNIYRQFAVTMGVAILFSAFLALSLTPALCATLLKPVTGDHQQPKFVLFTWFNRLFNYSARHYQGLVEKVVTRIGRGLLIYLVIVAVVGWMMWRMPTGFIPDEDQGQLFTIVQMPPAATADRTQAIVQKASEFYMAQPEVSDVIAVVGMSFVAKGQNTANIFTMLKPWDERKGEEHSVGALAARAAAHFETLREGLLIPLVPPSIQELGTGSGFALRLQDRGRYGHGALTAAANRMISLSGENPVIGSMRIDSVKESSQMELVIDREKAYALAVDFSDVQAVLSTALGSRYVNDFPSSGRMQQVIVQADASFRMQPEDILGLEVRNRRGEMVPLAAFMTTQWRVGPVQMVRYNGYPAVRLAGTAAPGYSTGEAMDQIESLMAELPKQLSLEWHGVSREERISDGQMASLLGLSMLAVFLALAALYESWSIPFAVLLVVPLGVLGSLLGATLAGMPNDVYFKVGLIAIIGLSAKNAILIIEFARHLQQQGEGLVPAALTACRLRFRPILMTSLAFTMGVVPLVTASGAGSAGQQAVGTGVMGGMIAATVLAVFLVPVFYIAVRRLVDRKKKLSPLTSAVLKPD